MKHVLAIVVFGLGIAFVSGQDDKKDDAKKDDAKKELESLQGTWKTQLVEESSGKRSGPAEFGDSSLVVKEDKYVFTLGPDEVVINGMKVKVVNKEEGALKVDPTKKPKTMDVVITDGEAKGKVQLGVYELDGDTLKVTVNEPGDANRPKEMGKGAATFTFKRAK